jgi:hypothetical protein
VTFALALSLLATAHLMPARQGTLNVIGTGVFVVVSLPAAALERRGAGDLTSDELQQDLSLISDQLKRRFRVFDGTHQGRVDYLQFDAQHGDEFVALMKVSFDEPPTALRVETDLVRDELTLKFLRGAQSETVVLHEERAAVTPLLLAAVLLTAFAAWWARRRGSQTLFLPREQVGTNA